MHIVQIALTGTSSAAWPLTKIWGKNLTGINLDARGGFALEGEWIPRNGRELVAVMTPGEVAALVVCRPTPHYWVVRALTDSVDPIVEPDGTLEGAAEVLYHGTNLDAAIAASRRAGVTARRSLARSLR